MEQRAAITGACGKMLSSADKQKACATAVASVRDSVGRITMCDAAFSGDEVELACVEALAGAPGDMKPAWDACNKMLDGDTLELACLEAVGSTTEDPTPLIEACDASRSGDKDELACIQDAMQ